MSHMLDFEAWPVEFLFFIGTDRNDIITDTSRNVTLCHTPQHRDNPSTLLKLFMLLLGSMALQDADDPSTRFLYRHGTWTRDKFVYQLPTFCATTCLRDQPRSIWEHLPIVVSWEKKLLLLCGAGFVAGLKVDIRSVCSRSVDSCQKVGGFTNDTNHHRRYKSS